MVYVTQSNYQSKYLKYRNRYTVLRDYLRHGGGKLETSITKLSKDLFKIDSDRIGTYPSATSFKSENRIPESITV